MDTQGYWKNKLGKYSQEEWSEKPSKFLTEVEEYFPNGGTVLDLGAGLGQDTRYLAKKGWKVIWMDISEFGRDYAMEKAQIENLSNIEYQLADLGETLQLPKNSVEVIYSNLGTQFFSKERTRKLFEEIGEILKPGGILAIAVNSKNDPEIEGLVKIDEDYYENMGGLKKRFFDTESLAEMVEGFDLLLLDNKGGSEKGDMELIRLVGRKI